MRRFAVVGLVSLLFAVAAPSSAEHSPQLKATPVAFAPAVLQVDPGQDITFQSLDPLMDHAFRLQDINIKICGSGEVPVPCYAGVAPLQTNFISIHRDAAPGTYLFECAFHRHMVGRLTVRDPSTTP